jgi:hypothetical protein
MPQAAIGPDVHQPFNIHSQFTTQVPFDGILLFDNLPQPCDLLFREILHACIRADGSYLEDLF